MPIFKQHIISKAYFPGLISLLVLPLMCIGYFAYLGRLKGVGLITIVHFTKTDINNWNKGKKVLLYPDNYKAYTTIVLDGNNSDKKMSMLDYLAKQLLKKDDYTNGIRVKFTDKTLYGYMVAVLDIPNRYDKIDCAFYENEVLLWKDKPPVGGYFRDIDEGPVYIKHGISYLDGLNSALTSLIPFWPCLIILAVMIILSLSGKRKYYIS